MRSYKFELPWCDLPIRMRPWFFLFTLLIMVVLAFLSITNLSRSLPFKLLHLTCACLATCGFYFIFDIEEDARRLWIWRHANLILTACTCLILGGIYKDSQMGDLAANLVGSTIGLFIAYHLERYYRLRREISQLYRQVVLDPDALPDSGDESDESDATLAPLHRSLGQSSSDDLNFSAFKGKSSKNGTSWLGDIWNEREELFDVGDDDEDKDERIPVPRSSVGPTIIVTSS